MERRTNERHDTALLGTISLSENAAPITCVVLNIGPGGARLRVPGRLMLPATGTLEIPRHDLTYRIRLAWRRQEDIGVWFEDAESEDNPGARGPEPKGGAAA